MSKIEVNYTDYWKETLEVLADEGALLVSVDENGKPNAMTIQSSQKSENQYLRTKKTFISFFLF